MDKYLKFLNSLSKKEREKILSTLEKLSQDQISDLDIKKLTGISHHYRIRIGKIRIVFKKADNKNIVLTISFRKNSYS